MTETLRVRPAVADDLPAVLAIYAQPGVDDGAMLSLDQARAILDRFAAYPDYTLYVAEQDGAVVGTFAMLVMDNLGHLGAPSAVVEDVAVAPAHQGNGVGQVMLRAAFAKARERGCYKLALSANMKRERAHAFYEALGMERHGYSFLIDPSGQDISSSSWPGLSRPSTPSFSEMPQDVDARHKAGHDAESAAARGAQP